MGYLYIFRTVVEFVAVKLDRTVIPKKEQEERRRASIEPLLLRDVARSHQNRGEPVSAANDRVRVSLRR